MGQSNDSIHLVEFGKYANKTLLWVFENDKKFFPHISKYTEYYTPKKKKYFLNLLRRFKNEGFISPIKSKAKVDQVLVWMKESLPIGEIRKRYNELYNIKEGSRDFEFISTDARRLLSKDFEREKKYLIDTHILRYNSIFNEKSNPDISKVSPVFRNEFLTNCYESALDALKSKEKLLGLHTKNFKIEVNNFFEKKKSITAIEFNFFGLSLKEKIDLKELLDFIINQNNFTHKKLNIDDSVKKSSINLLSPIKYKKHLESNEDETPITSVKESEVIEEPIQEESNIHNYMPKNIKSKTVSEVNINIVNSIREKMNNILSKK